MDVFVYGTLTDPTRVERVLDSYVFVGAAVLEGLHPVEGRYPTLAPGGRVAGRILRTDEDAALDRYEGLDRDLYVRVSVPWTEPPDGNAADEAAVYVGDPERLDAAESVAWPGEGPLAERVRRYVEREDVAVRPTPTP